jgi:hypothetical protein
MSQCTSLLWANIWSATKASLSLVMQNNSGKISFKEGFPHQTSCQNLVRPITHLDTNKTRKGISAPPNIPKTHHIWPSNNIRAPTTRQTTIFFIHYLSQKSLSPQHTFITNFPKEPKLKRSKLIIPKPPRWRVVQTFFQLTNGTY